MCSAAIIKILNSIHHIEGAIEKNYLFTDILCSRLDNIFVLIVSALSKNVFLLSYTCFVVLFEIFLSCSAWALNYTHACTRLKER